MTYEPPAVTDYGRLTDLTEAYFPLSDQAGFAQERLGSMRGVAASPARRFEVKGPR
jgi:hypothetical protein